MTMYLIDTEQGSAFSLDAGALIQHPLHATVPADAPEVIFDPRDSAAVDATRGLRQTRACPGCGATITGPVCRCGRSAAAAGDREVLQRCAVIRSALRSLDEMLPAGGLGHVSEAAEALAADPAPTPPDEAA